ncbi:hypothetical protein WJ88_12230 [Burkholderia ubonensis]|nr:hypothetical protein WJ88_12230 [Burkholderia ubonensis]
MPPHDLDLVEFGTVGRQIEQDSVMIDQPPIPCRYVDAVMNAGVIQPDYIRAAIVHRKQIVDKSDNVGAFDAAGMDGVDQRVRAVVQGTQNATSAVRVRFDLVRQASW